MSFRRTNNRYDNWKTLVAENADLLASLPNAAIANESSLRSYVTNGTLHGIGIHPAVHELSPEAVDALWTFVHHKAEFDMDASLFDDLNAVFRRGRT